MTTEKKQKHITKIIITIDTEFSLGGYFHNKKNKPIPADKIIYCKIGDKEYGINRIMDILDQYDMQGEFFVETESRFYFGEKEVLKIIDSILSRGHKVQLHIHPTYRSFIKNEKIPDDMRKYTVDDQSFFIKEALNFLEKNKINILAYRSGGFYSNRDTLYALKQNGNYNLAFPNCDYIKDYPGNNDIFKADDIFELPITCYKEPPVRKEWNSFQLSAASLSEIENALNFYHLNKLQVATFITHSFEFVKAHNTQYAKTTPLKFLINRFDKMCRFIAENSDRFKVVTFEQLDHILF